MSKYSKEFIIKTWEEYLSCNSSKLELCNKYGIHYKNGMYEIIDEESLRFAIKDYIRFYSEERIQERFNNKTPLEIRTEAMASEAPTKYPIPENKRIKK